MQIQKHGAPLQRVHQCATEHCYAEAIRGNKISILIVEKFKSLLHISTVALSEEKNSTPPGLHLPQVRVLHGSDLQQPAHSSTSVKSAFPFVM